MSPDSKSIFASKTFWIAVLSPLVTWAASKYLVGLSPQEVGDLTEAISALAAAMIGSRMVTNQPVHILPPK